MSPEQKLANDRRKAEQAKALMENEALQEAFARMEEQYIEAWRTSNVQDSHIRETFYLRLNALTEFKKDLEKVAQGHKVTAYNMRSALSK